MTPHPDHPRIVWGHAGHTGRLVCPRCDGLDVAVTTPAEGARAVAAHLQLHATDADRHDGGPSRADMTGDANG